VSASLDDQDLKALDEAFRMASMELGLGANADDNRRRERLSGLIIHVASQGERDVAAIANSAVTLMKVNGNA